MANNDATDRGKNGQEMFYLDQDGNKQDAALHDEMLGADVMPWDLDLELYGNMTPEEQTVYLKKLDDAMKGEGV